MTTQETLIPRSIPTALPESRRRRIAKVMTWCAEAAPEAGTVRFAFGVKKGIGSNPLVMLTWFSSILLIFQQFRVVAVTDDSVLVFESGWFTRQTPKRLLAALPGDTPLQPGRGGSLQLGAEKVTVDPLYAKALLAYLADRVSR